MEIVNIKQFETMSIDEIQKLHINEVKLINEVDQFALECVEGSRDIKELADKIDEYIEHVKEHFSIEEELMEKYNFPSTDLHEMAHQMFLADLAYATKHFKEQGDLNKIVTFIRRSPEWMETHITAVDAPTAEYIARKREEKNNSAK